MTVPLRHIPSLLGVKEIFSRRKTIAAQRLFAIQTNCIFESLILARFYTSFLRKKDV